MELIIWQSKILSFSWIHQVIMSLCIFKHTDDHHLNIFLNVAYIYFLLLTKENMFHEQIDLLPNTEMSNILSVSGI